MLQLKQRRERGCIPLFTQKANKTPRQGVCTVYVGPQAAACPTLISLLHESQKPRQISRRGEPLCSRWEFSLKRRIRKEDMGGARFPRNWSLLYFPGKLFILLVVHRDQWIIQSYAGSAALTLIKTRLSFCESFCIQRVSGDLHYLLAKKPVNILCLSSLMNVNLISPKVFFFNLHHP